VPKCIYSVKYFSRSLILISEDSSRGKCNYYFKLNVTEDSPGVTSLQLLLQGRACDTVTYVLEKALRIRQNHII